MDNQPTKSFNEKGGKNRLRFASAKSRAKRASADVYRSSENKLSTSAVSVREKRVHDTSTFATKKRKKKKGKNKDGQDEEMDDEDEVRYFGNDNDAEGLSMGCTAVIVSSKSKLRLDSPQDDNMDEVVMYDKNGEQLESDELLAEEEEEEEALITGGTIFLEELELSAQRNGSQLYSKLVRESRPLCKSLAELLHHGERIVDLLYAYLLSPRGGDSDDGCSATPIRKVHESWKSYKKHLSTKAPNGYVINVATNDVLHLLGVLARELQQEIYPFLNTRILPHIIDDMLNPPTTIAITSITDSDKKHHNNVPLDVNHIESAARTLSYLFKYNAEQLIQNHLPKQKTSDDLKASPGKKQHPVADADILRQYYGKTICHKRDIVRKLTCEAYAPLLRKCLDKGLKRHLIRTVKALAGSLAAASLAESDRDDAEGEISITNSARKARSDAIDGVSSLVFEVARGAPGKVHSKKGWLVVRSLMDCLLSTKTNGDKKSGDNHQLALEKNKSQAIYEVASQFLYKLRGHVVRGTPPGSEQDPAGSSFADVLDELHQALDTATSMMKGLSSSSQAKAAPTTANSVSLGHAIDLMTETINFQDGRLVSTKQDSHRTGADRVANSLQALLNNAIYSNASRKLQDQILQYLCTAWRTNPSHPSFALRLGKFFPSIVASTNPDKPNSSVDDGLLDPALFLGRNLLPYLPKKVASKYLIPALLGAVASSSYQTEKSDESSLVLLHTVATAAWPRRTNPEHSNDIDIDDAHVDALFTCEAAEHCPEISYNLRISLFDMCLANDLEIMALKKKRKVKASHSSSIEQQLAHVGYISRCIPFLVCLECSGSDESSDDEDSRVDNSQSEDLLSRVFRWYSTVLRKIESKMKDDGQQDKGEAFIVQSLILESFSKSVMECHKRVTSPKVSTLVKDTLKKVKGYASSLLFRHPASFWVVRGVAAVTKAFSDIDPGSKLNDKSNETFELLVTNLAQANHFLRLYTLQILESYPARPFVTDHADLDLTDDLEEEPSHKPQLDNEEESNADGSFESSLTGSCDIISMLRILESIPVALPNERKLTSHLSRVEVYARTGKLPIIYAEAVTCHMLGLLHIKFSPVWPAAVKVIVSLSIAQEGPTWPHIEAALRQSMRKISSADMGADEIAKINDGDESCHTKTISHHHSLCGAWEKSRGKNIDIFGPQNQERNAQVSRHMVSDELTLFGNIWSIMENGPHLTSTKSKTVVPIYFEFLFGQYYVFHDDDPDLREIDFAGLVESHTPWPKEILGRKSLQKKLEIFLNMFAAVKGPQQLFKHKVLLQICVSFLGNPDPKLSNLAFACVLRFKLPYLTPYADYVQPMLKREGLREALTKFDLSEDSEVVDAEHRLLLLPIVTRILFGRFSSRGNGTKSSKDSPAARRAAILSFFSGIGNDEGELGYFIYMMVRAFIPQGVSTKSEGVQMDKESLLKLIGASEKITSDELTDIPVKRQEGFLNLLSDVITQIGFGAKRFVGTFMSLLLALCEQTEVALIDSIKNQALKDEAIHTENMNIEDNERSRIGRVRTLSFLRLSDLMTKFASSVDFSEYGGRLWKSMSTSVIALPNTVVNAENSPSLLQFLESISLHHRLIPLLQQSDDAVVAVFKCIAGTTRVKVMSSVLRIIDGLLTDGGTPNDTKMSDNEQSPGQALILKHIHMLIAQFTHRLSKESQQIVNLDEDVAASRGFANKGPRQSPTDGLQLNVLCRVTDLLVSARQADDEHITTMENLCNLLVPLLKFDSRPNQLYVIRTVNSLIPKLSGESAMSHFHTLSKLLGPYKNRAGITSNEHRQIISSAISAICSKNSVGTKWKLVAQAVADVNSVSTSYVDEHDFERMLPVMNGLGATSSTTGSWLDLSMVDTQELQKSLKQSKTVDGTRILLPLIYTCFNMLYDTDGVVSRAANKALKILISTSSEQALLSTEKSEDTNRNPWVKLMETMFVPCLKIGIMNKEVGTRRSFILLVSHIARHFASFKSVHLYGDLSCLIRDDDQEVDFFLNVTHVQLHRKAKAFNRLRRLLSAHAESAGQSPLFSAQSFGNILLPLAMHPVYECNSNEEEAYVIEAIATVGEICKHLSWSKYNSTLQSVLNSLGRYPDQERFLIAMLCAIIDAFHFSVVTGEGPNAMKEAQVKDLPQGNGVWRSLNNRIIPKVESFLTKEKVDKRGYKNKSLRSSVVLALMKLFQKLPIDTFEAKLPKLITVVCIALRNKDSNERDTARNTISKMAVGLDMRYLPLILSEMSVSLHEGYKLHVRSAALHSMLVEISKVYQEQTTNSIHSVTSQSFDRCVPAMMDLIHQDIFGRASEIKEVKHAEKRLIKEAMGRKSQDSLEIISKSIHFKPSLATAQDRESYAGFTHSSAVHALVTPFLDRLRDPDVSPSTMRKVKECLHRVAVGFSTNPSAKYDEVLPFVFATVAPFIDGKIRHIGDQDADLEDSDDEVEAPIQVSKSNHSSGAGGDSVKRIKIEVNKAVAVATWTPTNLGHANDQKSALDMKKKQKHALHKVTDGATAPKLTGSSRHSPLKSSKAKSLNNPANACAVNFGLTLLNSALKRSRLDVSDESLCAMADPYLRLLTHCVRFSSDNHAVILSLRCLGIFLRMDLPSVPRAAKDLGPSILDHLTAAGAASNTQSDLVQACFKTLTLLISHQKFSSPDNQNSTVVSLDDTLILTNCTHSETLPLTGNQMQALLSLLHSSVREFDHHNATFGLVKAISSKRFVSSEFYDLMDIILKLSVQSQKSAIRLLSSQIFLQYLIDYPMGKQRMDAHLHQIVLNMKYEYEEGRLSAIDLLSSVIQKFPLPVLEEKSQFFFFPLVLQLVNDDSKKCKETVAGCIFLLLQRLSTESVQALFGYARRWSQSSGADSLPMQRASAQLFGIFIDARPDYVKRGSNAADLVSVVVDVMEKQIPFDDESGWELLYHSLLCAEKLNKQMPTMLSANYDFWGALVSFLAYPHPWIMQVSTRIITSYLSTLDPKELKSDGSESFIVKIPGCTYKIARNACRQLDVEDVHFVETTSTLAIKAISWVFRAMKQHPDICYDNDSAKDRNEGSKGEEDVSEKQRDPCLWVMTRLSNIAKQKGSHRRGSVFKCFAALCTVCNTDQLIPYMELMIDPIDRAIREATNMLGPDDQVENDPEITLPKDVLQLLEDGCGTQEFVRAYSEVNRKVREKRDKRKQEIASEAVHDPAAAAQRKIKKQLMAKDRRKRKGDDKRSMGGVSRKRRHD